MAARFRISALLFLLFGSLSAGETKTHPAIRPLPVANPDRPAPAVENVFSVDGKRGSNDGAGTAEDPWKTISHAVTRLRPGDTLLIRGGLYHERVRIANRGTVDRPVVVRSAPGELAVIDGGFPEFFHDPETAWEPLGNGEFRSVRSFPGLGTKVEGRTHLLGNFANSMIPLHGYRFLSDLRSDNHLFHRLDRSKTEKGENGLYCGPGVFYDVPTGRIHVRLAHTEQPSLPEGDNYRGETDPRRVRLVIAGPGEAPLFLETAAHVRIEDIVVRGCRDATINLEDCSNITLDGVTSYGGNSALRVESTSGLRCVNCAFRGMAAPWLWRWSLKYRSIEGRIVSASSWNPPARGNRDFEFAFCEFTDCVDGVFVGNVEDCSIHHCLLDNVSDDGFFLTCRTAYDGSVSGSAEIHHNRVSRVLTAFAYGVGHGRQKTIDGQGNKQLGGGVRAHHNVFDFREPVLYQEPKEGPITTYGRVCGDHGSPAWEPLVFEFNTIFSRNSPWRNYYAAGWGKAMGKGTRRVIRNNVFIHQSGMPGEVLPGSGVDLEASDNLHWSEEAGNGGEESFLKPFRASPLYSQTGWTKGDVYAPPGSVEGRGAGPDFAVGQWGSHLSDGRKNAGKESPPKTEPFRHVVRPLPEKRAALVLGYPAFDAPLLQYALEKMGVRVDVFERTWLPASRYGDYDLVAILGNTLRARMEPSGFSEGEFSMVKGYLENGGNLIIGRELTGMLFPGDKGKAFARSLFGETERSRQKPDLRILLTEHDWVSHLERSDWVSSSAPSSIFVGKGRNIIGDPELSRSSLADVPVGKGRLVYIGWELSRYLPPGRKPSTVEEETFHEKQYQILERIAGDLLEDGE